MHTTHLNILASQQLLDAPDNLTKDDVLANVDQLCLCGLDFQPSFSLALLSLI